MGWLKLKRKKVFCQNCRWLKKSKIQSTIKISYDCAHPDNIVTVYVDEWLNDDKVKQHECYPEWLNRNNHCVMYSKKDGNDGN